MDSLKNVILAAVVALVVSLLAFAGYTAIVSPQKAEGPVMSAIGEPVVGEDGSLGAMQGVVLESPYVFKNGSSDGGDYLTITRNGKIGRQANQAAWRNTTGRTVYVLPEQVFLGYESGTASSSWAFYVSTSTASTVSDYSRPTPAVLLMDGAIVATSTGTGGGAIGRVGTTTSAGTAVAVPNGSYVVFNVQEQFACKTIGACETATSTNRGVTEFLWSLTARYRP